MQSAKTAIIVAVITAIGSIAVALIGGYYLLQNTALQKSLDLTMTAYVNDQTSVVQQTLNAAAIVTDTPRPSLEEQSAHTPLPTDTLQPPAIPTDTFTPVSIDTDPNSTLAIGQTWRTDGLEVLLREASFRFSDELDLYFVFVNNTGETLFFNFNEDIHVTLTDNNGNIYTWRNEYEQDVVLEDGDTYTEQVYKGGDFSGAEYFIVDLNIPGIITARWRYN